MTSHLPSPHPPPADIAAIKASLREAIKRSLGLLAEAEQHRGSQEICRQIAAAPFWQEARTVMMFAPIRSEPNLRPLAVEMLRRGRLCLPRVDWHQKRMAAAAVRDLDRSLILRRNNILEPRPECPEVPPGEIDLILVPGLGFDRSGRRLGRGGGFYDRFLAEPTLRAVRCGVLFEPQLVESIPAEPHDIVVDYLVSPGQLWKT